MPELLKNRFNHVSLHQLAVVIHSVYNPFKVDKFLTPTMDETWNDLELKGRIHKVNLTLGKYLPPDYVKAINIIDEVVKIRQGDLYGFWIFPTFIEIYGQGKEHWDTTINALENYTKYSTSEFAVRPFIIKHEERMMAQMHAWAMNTFEGLQVNAVDHNYHGDSHYPNIKKTQRLSKRILFCFFTCLLDRE